MFILSFEYVAHQPHCARTQQPTSCSRQKAKSITECTPTHPEYWCATTSGKSRPPSRAALSRASRHLQLYLVSPDHSQTAPCCHAASRHLCSSRLRCSCPTDRRPPRLRSPRMTSSCRLPPPPSSSSGGASSSALPRRASLSGSSGRGSSRTVGVGRAGLATRTPDARSG